MAVGMDDDKCTIGNQENVGWQIVNGFDAVSFGCLCDFPTVVPVVAFTKSANTNPHNCGFYSQLLIFSAKLMKLTLINN